MFKERYVFAQLVAFLNRSKFNRIVAKYNGDKYVKHFTCWNQHLCLMFAQISNRARMEQPCPARWMVNVAEAAAKGNIVEGSANAAPHGQELRPRLKLRFIFFALPSGEPDAAA